MDLDLKSLRLFVRIAALGAIGRAGAEFGLSATAATQRVRALEKALGVSLLHRTTRAVSLSADGEIFLEHAKRIVGNVEAALSDIQCEPDSIRGSLRIASSASFGRLQIMPHIAEFLEAFPKVSIQLDLSDDTVDMVEQGFDLAIRLGELAPSTLKARPLGVSPRVLVAAPSYLHSHGQPESLEDLKHHNCLARADVRTWKFRTPDNTIQEARINGNFATNLAEGITIGAVTGIGIARKCKWEIADQLQSGALETVLDDYVVVPEWKVFAVRSPSNQPPPRVRAFTDFLEKKFTSVPALTL
ncbi:MAG: LysR family transcriptional regulator [Pseudomonadota bacterium]